MTVALASRVWAVWFLASIVFFGCFEGWALAAGQSQFTLSAAVWRWEGYARGQTILQWTAPHLLFIGLLILMNVWLIGHFGWHLWAGGTGPT